jgi:hypothetical protein
VGLNSASEDRWAWSVAAGRCLLWKWKANPGSGSAKKIWNFSNTLKFDRKCPFPKGFCDWIPSLGDRPISIFRMVNPKNRMSLLNTGLQRGQKLALSPVHPKSKSRSIAECVRKYTFSPDAGWRDRKSARRKALPGLSVRQGFQYLEARVCWAQSRVSATANRRRTLILSITESVWQSAVVIFFKNCVRGNGCLCDHL